MKYYKVWVEVEEIDEENDEYTSIDTPEPVSFHFAKYEDAREVQVALADQGRDTALFLKHKEAEEEVTV